MGRILLTAAFVVVITLGLSQTLSVSAQQVSPEEQLVVAVNNLTASLNGLTGALTRLEGRVAALEARMSNGNGGQVAKADSASNGAVASANAQAASANSAVTTKPGQSGISAAPAQRSVSGQPLGVSDARNCVSESDLRASIEPWGEGFLWEDYPSNGHKLAGSQGLFKEDIRLSDLKQGGKYSWVAHVDVEGHSFSEMSGGDDNAIVGPKGKLGTIWIRNDLRCQVPG